ncbi:hypothetical protein F4813DRAFT_398393 [Daldinia decipiens]|uniref:uncharacterized protein n=1 Tax=Daldinia decipiens TaxID=326647 RepID=UPI0020C5728B|nr:uncharacterized protein F4813DRAFT_398393 [Daldinia decipiens]KAI1661934.1 hypothetical protein F4813DRAFT_398393 [Daldinia decipiens]
MDHDHAITIELGKPEEYDQSTEDITPSPTPRPASDQRNQRPLYAASTKSCFFCRNTLLLSYFNCCAVCLGTIERSQSRNKTNDDNNNSNNNSNERLTSDSLPLPTTQPREPSASPTTTPPPYSSSSSSSSSSTTENNYNSPPAKPPHCPSPYCRYTHARPLMLLFALGEAVPSLGGLALLNAALYRHDWAQFRFAGMLALQWWQIFVLPRQWARGRSVVAGQLVACLFMVWFYVDGSRSWRWWEPLAVSTVLLKIVFPW